MSEKTLVAYDEILQRARRYKRSLALLKIAQLSCQLEKAGQYICAIPFENNRIDRTNVMVSQDALAFVSSLFAVCGNDDRDKVLSHDEILLLCNWYTNLEYPKPKSQLEILIRLSQEQLPFQDLGTYSFARSYYLMQAVSKRSGFSAPIDVEASFFDWAGLSIDDYYWLSWCLFSLVYQASPAFTSAVFIAHDIEAFREVLVPEKLEKYLRVVSGGVEILRVESEAINYAIPAMLKKWQFNILSRYPVFRFPDKVKQQVGAEYVIVNSKLMLNKIVDGPYWALRDLFLAKGVEGDRRFLSFWGEIFEKYVGELLQRIYSKVFSLNEYDPPQGMQNADWLVVTDAEVYLFECKSPLLPVAVKGALDEVKVNAWCKANIIKSEGQLAATEGRIKSGELTIPDCNLKGKRIVKVLVTLQSLFFEAKWLQYASELNGGSKWDGFYILSVADLELYESAKEKVVLIAIFEELSTAQASHNFRTLCASKAGKRLFNEFLISVNKKFWAPLERQEKPS